MYQVLAKIMQDKRTLDVPKAVTWFQCGVAFENGENTGEFNVVLNGLPLNQRDWDGMLYIRIDKGRSGQQQNYRNDDDIKPSPPF